VAVLVTMIVIGPWMLAQAVLFARNLLDSIASIR
jgi:flagellar biosynthesis protein FliQ